MEEKRIKKISPIYLLGSVFGPMIVCGLCFLLSYLYFPKGTGAVILIMGPTFLAVIWWIFGGSFLFKRKTKKFERTLDASGFHRNHTFYGRGKTVMIDEVRGSVGLVFFWNPFQTYVFPASRIEKAWVDDGRGGKGFLEGSSRVSFLFLVDGIKIRVDTFTSNQRWRMDSDYILTGISKADVVVQALNEARARS